MHQKEQRYYFCFQFNNRDCLKEHTVGKKNQVSVLCFAFCVLLFVKTAIEKDLRGQLPLRY